MLVVVVSYEVYYFHSVQPQMILPVKGRALGLNRLIISNNLQAKFFAFDTAV